MKKGEGSGTQGEASVEPRLTTSHQSSGFRRRFAGLAVFVSMVAAACGVGGETPAASKALPTETPGPTMPASPSETPFQTLGEASTAVPVTHDGFLRDIQQGGAALDKYKAPVTVNQLQTAYNIFMADSADATFVTVPGLFPDCIDPTQPALARQAYCADLTNRVLKASDATGSQNQPAQHLATLMTNYDIGTSGVFNTPNALQNLAAVLQS